MAPGLLRSLVGARSVVVGGVILVMVVLLFFAAFAVYERSEQLKQQRSELLVRVLEDHATRSVETVALALGALADVVARSGPGDDRLLGDALTQALVGMHALRSLALLDARGQVLASTVPSELGLTLNLQKFVAGPGVGRQQLGTFVAGRGPAAVAGGQDQQNGPVGLGFLPMLQMAVTRSGEGRVLVAVINPNAIANYQQQVLSDAARVAVLSALDA